MTWFDDGGNRPPHEPPAKGDAIPSRAADLLDPGLLATVAQALQNERWMFDPPGLNSFRLAEVAMRTAADCLGRSKDTA